MATATFQQTRDDEPMLDLCWATINLASGGPVLIHEVAAVLFSAGPGRPG